MNRSVRGTQCSLITLVGRTFALAALVALTLVALHDGPRSANAQSEGTGTLQKSFESAARHWDVPLPVLMAVGYVESHWEQRGGEPSLDNGFGIMHITDGPTGTLQRAAELTGLPGDAIKLTSAANIEAGAALLSDISRKLSLNDANRKDLARWYSVVASYSGAPDESVRQGYADQVFSVIQNGQKATLSDGETIFCPAESVGGLPSSSADTPASDDYPPALWVPANSNNYTVGRPYGPLSFIVIHDTEGSYASAISWFQNPALRCQRTLCCPFVRWTNNSDGA